MKNVNRHSPFVIHPFLIGIALLSALFLSALNLWFGELNQDEGWYLYSARLIAEGKRPFVDFASTQGPVMSYVYAALWAPIHGMGLAGGRLVTAVLGWGAAGLAALLAWRLGGDDRRRRGAAAFTAFTLIGVNITQSYFTTVVKTYALGGLLMTGGFVALAARPSTAARGRIRAAAAGILLALAAGTRASLVMPLPVVFLWLLLSRYKAGRPAFPWSFAVGAAAALLAVFGPFLLAAPQALWFGMAEYHSGREAGSLFALLAYKAAFILRTLRAWFIPVALLLASLVVRLGSAGTEEETTATSPVVPTIRRSAVHLFGGSPQLLIPLVLSGIAVTLTHFMAPFPYDDYQAVLFPLFAAAVAVWSVPLLLHRGVQLLVLVLCLMSALASPRCQDWFAAPRDRIWWPMRTQSPVAQLRQVARTLRAEVGPDGVLLTQDTYLAVEAGLHVPPGMEMGPFCYFPDMTRERAAALHVLNREMLTGVLATTEAPFAAFSEYGLTIASPAVQPIPLDETRRLQALLESRYTPVATIPAFGQAQTLLTLYRRRGL